MASGEAQSETFFGYPVRLAVVLAMGALSALLALGVVWYVASQGTNLMLWSVYVVIPVGPFLVGVLASFGFTAGARLAGVRASNATVLAVCALLLASYFIAEYLEFRVMYPNGVVDRNDVPLTFWAYFDFMTREQHFGSHPGVGLWGYLLRFLDVIGFLAGGVYGLLMSVGTRPHCAKCNRFQRSTVVGYLDETNAQGFERVLTSVADGRALASALRSESPFESWPTVAKAEARMLFRFARCQRCNEGSLSWERVRGEPARQRGAELGRRPLEAPRVSEFLSVWNAAES